MTYNNNNACELDELQFQIESSVPQPLDLVFVVGSEPLASSAHCKDTHRS
jgi:hypothetical protein